MKYIAHRGVVNNFTKENTLDAFLLTIKSKEFVGFELDIRESKDEELFVYHDYLLKKRPFKTYKKKELKKLNIPTLKSVLNLNHHKIVLIEIKDFNMNLKKFVNLLNKYHNLTIYIMSFSNKVIKKLSQMNHNCKVGILNYVLNNEENYNYNFVGLLNILLDEDLINKYQRKDVEVLSYGILRKQKLLYKDIYYIIDSDKI